jgi:hypothetical protein
MTLLHTVFPVAEFSERARVGAWRNGGATVEVGRQQMFEGGRGGGLTGCRLVVPAGTAIHPLAARLEDLADPVDGGLEVQLRGAVGRAGHGAP